MQRISIAAAAVLVYVVVFLVPIAAFASHPLITDDAGTQGKGKFLLEVNGQYDRDKETEAGVSVKETAKEVETLLTYGAADDLDLVVGIPYIWATVKEDGATVFDGSGKGDLSLEAKWRFYEHKGLSFALKPGITLPTGDETEGFGTGKPTFGLYFIASREVNHWELIANLGFVRNENKVDEEKNIWHMSAAAVYAMTEHLKAAANIGVEKNADPAGSDDSAFLLGGVIYEVNGQLDLDAGVKFGLTDAEADLALLCGIAVKF